MAKKTKKQQRTNQPTKKAYLPNLTNLTLWFLMSEAVEANGVVLAVYPATDPSCRINQYLLTRRDN